MRAWNGAIAAGVLALLAGCSLLTPRQAAGLKEAQRIADTVTRAYGVGRVRVFAAELPEGSSAAYSGRADWILIQPEVLEGDELVLVLAHELGHVTLRHRAAPQASADDHEVLEQYELAANRRGVEIMGRILGIGERQAVERYALFLVEAARLRRGRAIQLPIGHLHPCEQLSDLWSSFDMGAPAPACEGTAAPP